jgi:hypothetical protein
MKRSFVLISALALAAVASGSAFAESIVYNQPPPLSSVVYNSSDTSGIGAHAYDSFTLAQDTTILGVDWYGAQSNTNPIPFTITFYSDDPLFHAPGSTVYTENPLVVLGPDSSYSADTNSFTLLANHLYWISILGNVGNPASNQWYWENSNTGDGLGFSFDNTTGVRQNLGNLAFDLRGNVDMPDPPTPPTSSSATPEPDSLLLTGSGILSIAGVVRRKLRRC